MKTHIILNTHSGSQILLPINSMIVKPSMRFDKGSEVWYSHEPYENSPVSVCETLEEIIALINEAQWDIYCDTTLGRALRDLGIETVAQVMELVGIACDACDERTVRATNRAENLVPLLRRRAAEGIKPKSTAHLTNPTR